jgi:hypothetical protein
MTSAGPPAMKRTASLLASFFLLSVACGDSDSDGSGGDGGSGGSGPSTTATTSTKSSTSTSTSASTSGSSTSGMTTATTDTVTTGTGGEGGTGGGGMACIHDVCTEGDALDPMCSDPCVATVCAEDGVCCDAMDGGWDDICVALAQRLCQAPCGLINYGDLVITEIMNNPMEALDANGEWIEIFNTTAAPIDLMGFSIYHDTAGAPHVVASSVVIAGGDYAVLGINSDMALNGGVVVDYVIPELSLNNADDYLAIETPSLDIIDELIYDQSSGLDPDGASRSLDPMFIDADANDDDTNFCVATTFISGGAGDTGTPGAANDPCP